MTEDASTHAADGAGWDETVLLDGDHLDGFTAGDPDVTAAVLSVFLEQAEQHLAALARADGDWSDRAHRLKGAARSIGAWRLAAAAARAEHLGAAPSGPARQSVLDDLSGRMGLTLDAVRDRLAAIGQPGDH
ncbi:Hpt domain-containing protein [Yunchengibacter salinarum]|uniref:Hpt domain-containing protein n=1 Tax=Yunchengibacter salinarum TaxID=3133399 RepID=UPI0035B571DF